MPRLVRSRVLEPRTWADRTAAVVADPRSRAGSGRTRRRYGDERRDGSARAARADRRAAGGSTRPLHVSLRVGTVMSLVNTAIGRVFAAHVAGDVLLRLLQQDGIRLAGEVFEAGTPDDGYQARLASIRDDGFDSALGTPCRVFTRLRRRCSITRGCFARGCGDRIVRRVRQRSSGHACAAAA